ncbi:MAG: hypothetical protein PVJ09_01170 [Candidatus Woesebacteria bacterium]|jgi:hypothetical protein
MKKILKMELFFFIVFLSLFSLGQLQRIELGQKIVFYFHDLLIFIWLLLVFFFKQKQLKTVIQKLKLKNIKLELLLIFWIIIGLSFNFLKNGLYLIPLLYLIRLSFYLSFAFNLSLINKQFQKNKYFNQLNLTRFLWVMAGLFVLFFGLLQYIFLPDTRFLFILGWDDHYYRLISTILDPAFTGLLFIFTLIYLQSLQIKNKDKFLIDLYLPSTSSLDQCLKKIKINFVSVLKIFASLLLILAVLLTYSRSSYLSLFIALILMTFKKIKQRQINKNSIITLLAYLFISITAIPLLPRPSGEGVKLERSSSIEARIIDNQSYLNSLQSIEYLIGKGIFSQNRTKLMDAQTAIPQHAKVPGNLIVFFLYYTGIVGLIIFISLLIKWGKILIKTDYYIFASFIALLTHSLFNNSFFQIFILLMFLGGVVSIKKSKNIKI